jgi:hypothetical protein
MVSNENSFCLGNIISLEFVKARIQEAIDFLDNIPNDPLAGDSGRRPELTGGI